jgi:hypothetical protein
MNEANRYARRYHWLGETVNDFVCEPHAAICSEGRGQVLNLVASDSASARTTIGAIAREETPEAILHDVERVKTLHLPRRHHLSVEDIHPERLNKGLNIIYDSQPKGFEELLALGGVGPKTIRALSLISELIYGVPASFHDPARYSFAHGGKDGIPYPVDRKVYDESIEILARAVAKARVERTDKREALTRLDRAFR